METTTRPTPAERVEQELSRYGNELVPGAASVLAQRWGSLGIGPDDQVAEKVAEHLPTLGKSYLNFEYIRPRTEAGGEPSTLRVVLNRRADLVKDGMLDDLIARLGVEAAGLSESKVTGIVARFLASREANDFLAVPIEPRPAERRVLALLLSHFPEQPPEWREALAGSTYGRDLQHIPDRQVVHKVAHAMRAGAFAATYGGRTLAEGDRRLSPDPSLSASNPWSGPAPTGPPRDDGGRFSTPPARQAPRSNF